MLTDRCRRALVFLIATAVGFSIGCTRAPSTSAAYTAIRTGNSQRLQKLLDSGLDPNAVYDVPHERCHLIHIAARFGNADAIETLVKCGANVNARDHEGRTPLMWIVINDNNGDAPVQNYVTCFELLIRHGADVNTVKDDGVSLSEYIKEFGNDVPDYRRLAVENGMVSN